MMRAMMSAFLNFAIPCRSISDMRTVTFFLSVKNCRHLKPEVISGTLQFIGHTMPYRCSSEALMSCMACKITNDK